MDTAAVVGRLVDRYNQHDLGALAECYAPGATVSHNGWADAIDAGTWMEYLGVMLATFPDLRVQPVNLVTEGGSAMLEARLTGTNTGPYPVSEAERLILGIQAGMLPPTGRAIDYGGAVGIQIADGLVTAEHHYWPLADQMIQLGLAGTTAPLG